MSETELQPTGEVEDLETGSESAPETTDGEPGEGQTAAPEGSGATKAINRKHFQFMEATRRADGLQARVDELEAGQPQEQRPEIPDLPDVDAANYTALMTARDEAIRLASAFDTRQVTTREQQQATDEKTRQDQQTEFITTAQTYTERAVKLGVSAEDLKAAGDTVAAYGISDELAQLLLDDDQGPLITAYLAKNPAELERLRTLPPLQAAVRVATEIKSKVKPTNGITNAPPPADTLDGGGTGPGERGPSGATYR